MRGHVMFRCVAASAPMCCRHKPLLLISAGVSTSAFGFATVPETSPPSSSLINEFEDLCCQRDLPRAMNAMDVLQSRGLRANSVAYAELIKCCLARGSVQDGRLIHRHILSGGHQPQTFVLNALLSMYVKFDLLHDARQLFDEMQQRNVVSWTTMISALVNAHLNDEALGFLVLMLRDGVTPNMFTYSSVLKACRGLPNLRQLHCGIVKHGLDSDIFVRSALIDVYSRWGELQTALHVFNEMETGDMVVWGSIIGSFAQNSDGEEALHLFKSMKRAGFPSQQGVLTSVLRACTSLGLLELGRQIHVHVIKLKRDLILDNALVDMYCKCGSFEDAYSTFTRMNVKDVISWSTMIAGLAQNGYGKQALGLFESMKASGTRPNYITMVGVLFACSHAGLLDDGLLLFQSMKQLFGINPGREHYGCMIDLLGRAGKLDEALELIQEMEGEPDAVTWRILLSACRVHRNVDLAIHAAKQVLRLDPEDAGTYILLSNIYANSQKWEDVAEVRRTMRDRGIKKEPGCSWIEVDKQIHTFILGDCSHPQINEISRVLHLLIRKLMEEGYVPDTNFVLQDLEGEQKEDSLRYHSEKLAIVFGLMSLSREKTIRIKKNIRICGDCHIFAKLVSKMEQRVIVIRDPVRYHHFQEGACSCGDYW